MDDEKRKTEGGVGEADVLKHLLQPQGEHGEGGGCGGDVAEADEEDQGQLGSSRPEAAPATE